MTGSSLQLPFIWLILTTNFIIDVYEANYSRPKFKPLVFFCHGTLPHQFRGIARSSVSGCKNQSIWCGGGIKTFPTCTEKDFEMIETNERVLGTILRSRVPASNFNGSREISDLELQINELDSKTIKRIWIQIGVSNIKPQTIS